MYEMCDQSKTHRIEDLELARSQVAHSESMFTKPPQSHSECAAVLELRKTHLTMAIFQLPISHHLELLEPTSVVFESLKISQHLDNLHNPENLNCGKKWNRKATGRTSDDKINTSIQAQRPYTPPTLSVDSLDTMPVSLIVDKYCGLGRG